MSAGGLLLRVVLMLSLLLNGLNVAMAAPMALALLPPAAAPAAEPPCHSMPADADLAGSHDRAAGDPSSPHDGDHCKLKDCLRNCAQQPSLTAQLLWIPTPPPLAFVPAQLGETVPPAPPLSRITRPPIA